MVYKKGLPMSCQPDVSRKHAIRVYMVLRDVLYLSYSLPAERIRPFVPELLPLATVADGTAFISIVVLQSTQVRVSLVPLLRFNYNQLNIRTYVVDPVSGDHAVYFIKSGVSSSFISLITRISGIPWQLLDLELKKDVHNNQGRYNVSGDWGGDFHLAAESSADSFANAPLFKTRQSAVDFLIRPLIGFIGDNRRLGRFTISHPEVQPRSWLLRQMDFPLFRELGLVDEFNNPHSVFYLPEADFSIYLPPRKIK